MNIVVTGSIAFDYLMHFPGRFSEVLIADQLHKISLSFLVDSMERQRGGIGPNIAYTIALLGGRPGIMASAGRDFGSYRAYLEKHGVDTSAIIEDDEDFTASFFVTTDLDHNQIASFYTGAMSKSVDLSFARLAPDVELTIVSPSDPVAMRTHVQECKDRGIPFIYDPSQQTIRLSGDDLRHGLDGCLLLTVNSYEFSLIQERTGLSEADIRQKAGGLLVTHGADGAELIVDDQLWHIPAVKPVEIAEPTGAGDAFRAGLMRGIQLGLPWDICGRIGALCSAYVLEQVGPQSHHFTTTEFVTRYREHFDDQGALNVLLEKKPTPAGSAA